MYPQVFGKYVLERELARGGMARVLLATLRGAGGFEKRLVVKQIRDDLASDEDFVRRFVEEAKTTVALAHPNIVPVYELGVELGTYFLAMEYVDGATLAEILRASGGTGRRGLSPEEGAYVGVEVCRALDYAHRRMNVVHRDVTPRNAMVDEEGQVKVIDFGISAPVATAPSGQGVFGSPGHMPPEQIEGKELTPAADVFAVAVLLMELWSGRPPFRRRTRIETEAAMCARHPRPSEADIRLLPLDDVLARSMSLDPTERPQHADELARALRKFLSGIDLGDVARQLGDRVRSVHAHPLPPSSEQNPLLQRPPSRPSATQVGTKTFAARDDLVAGRLADAESATRKLAPSAPPEADQALDLRRAAMEPPPEEPGNRGANRAGDVETWATRPLETAPTGHGRRPRLQRSFLWISGTGAATLAVAAFLLGRGAATAKTDPQSAPTPARPIGPVAAMAVSPAPTTSSAASVAPPLSSSGVATARAPVPPRGVAATAEPTTLAVADRAQIVLLGEGTYVTVDGVPRGRAPARVAVDPGAHSVLFAFPATGESRADALLLRGGERVTVRADFTGAQPTIRVQR